MMLNTIYKLIPIDDFKFIPIYVFEDMPPLKVADILTNTYNTLLNSGLEEIFLKKLRVTYLKPGHNKNSFGITNDKKILEIHHNQHLPVHKNVIELNKTLTWYNEHMNKYIIKIMPIEEIKYFPIIVDIDWDSEKTYLDILVHNKLLVYYNVLFNMGIPEKFIKIKFLKSKKAKKDYMKYSYFFYTDNKIVYIDIQGCKTNEDIQNRIKEVKNWWMIQKLQDL
jgi:hypothetical protein